jgi:hypothetical protein
MKTLKCTAFMLIIALLCFPVSAEKRKPKKTMKELTDPNSPSYVPYPYPKNRKEIIEDIRYYCVDLNVGTKSAFVGEVPIVVKIEEDLFSSNSKYKIGKIVKVKNRSSYLSEEFCWLVYVMDDEGDAVLRFELEASGIVMGSGAIDKNNYSKYSPDLVKRFKRLSKVLEEKNVKKFLSDSLGIPVDDKIKKMVRMGVDAAIGDITFPMWEITMKDGTVYYYSEIRDEVYEIEDRLPYNRDKNGLWPSRKAKVPHWNFFPDTINDELVVLKPVSKNKK